MSVEVVRAAAVEGRPVGLVMLKKLNSFIGYVFYIAVAKDYRRKRVGTTLLDHSLDYFSSIGMREVYSSVEEGNAESTGLFMSRGFSRTNYMEVAVKYGPLKALDLYRRMLVVPGETLLVRSLDARSEPYERRP